jgi:phosphoenolpyruvate carboxykinase (ATP)
MHCSANVGDKDDTHFLWFLEPEKQLYQQIQRKLIGDDGWTSENTVFNFEGGCYAKVINLEESEPDIFRAIKRTILENVVFKKTNEVDFEDVSITPNTRVS